MNTKQQVQTLEDAKGLVISGINILIVITIILSLVILLALIRADQFSISYLMPVFLGILLFLVRYLFNKLASLLLLAFPIVISINILKEFELNGSFWLSAMPFIVHLIFIVFFFSGCFKIIEGVFKFHRIKEHGKYTDRLLPH